jgi:hypothetical protein
MGSSIERELFDIGEGIKMNLLIISFVMIIFGVYGLYTFGEDGGFIKTVIQFFDYPLIMFGFVFFILSLGTL